MNRMERAKRDCSGQVLRQPYGVTGHIFLGQSPFLIHGMNRLKPGMIPVRLRTGFRAMTVSEPEPSVAHRENAVTGMPAADEGEWS